MHVRVTEAAPGTWVASIDGRDHSAVADRSPDQALASLIRSNLGLFGIAEVTYASSVRPGDSDAGGGGNPFAHGEPAGPSDDAAHGVEGG